MDNLKNKIHIIKSLYYTSEYHNLMLEIIKNKEVIVEIRKDGSPYYYIYNFVKPNTLVDIPIIRYLINKNIIQETGGCTYKDYFTTTYQIDYDLTNILKNILKDLTWSLPVQGDTVNIIRNECIYDLKFVTNIIFEPFSIELYIVFVNFKTGNKIHFPLYDIDNKIFQITKKVLVEKYKPNNWTFKNEVV